MAWSSIAASETDANSPLNQTLMDKIRGNLDYLYSIGSQVINITGSDSIARAATMEFTIDDTINYADRNLRISGIIAANGASVEATALANAQKVLPGGSEDDEICYDTEGGDQGAPSQGGTQNEFAFFNGFMYSSSGSGAYNTRPYITHPGINGNAYITDFYIWIDSSDGSLKVTVINSGTAYAWLGIAWNLQISYSEDQGGH